MANDSQYWTVCKQFIQLFKMKSVYNYKDCRSIYVIYRVVGAEAFEELLIFLQIIPLLYSRPLDSHTSIQSPSDRV